MSAFITKIKVKDGITEIRFKEDLGRAEKESIYKCEEPMHPDMERLFFELVPIAYHILQLPDSWCAGRVKIIGVSFSHSESTDVEGAVITGLAELQTANSPFCFNTPHLPFDQYSEAANSPIMRLEHIKKLERLKEEAHLYLKGKRAQLDLNID